MLVCREEMQEGMQERMQICMGGIEGGIQGDAGLQRSVAGLHVEGSAEFLGFQQDAFLCRQARVGAGRASQEAMAGVTSQ